MERKPLRIVFWGEDTFSNIILNSLIEAGHIVSLVVTPYYENVIYKKLGFTCDKYGIKHIFNYLKNNGFNGIKYLIKNNLFLLS